MTDKTDIKTESSGTGTIDIGPNTENERKILFETSNGERVYLQDTSIIVTFPAKRRTLTTSWINGGCQEDLKGIFNHKVPTKGRTSHELEGGSVPEYLKIAASRLGLDPSRASGLLTAANMRNAVIKTQSFRGLEVTAVVTGGIEVNGGRAGDPASYYQEDERYEPVGGTINVILLIGANMPPYALTRVLMTATEAKTAALQQLMASSRYSNGVATGSGTDMIAVVVDSTSSMTLTDAGKHSKLGEMIGKCVLEGVQEAVGLQSELTPLTQRDMLVRLDRFGVDESNYWKVASAMDGDNKKARFLKDLREISCNPSLVGYVASVLHIIDEISWGLIPENAGRKAALAMMRELPQLLGAQEDVPMDVLLNERESIMDNWISITAWIVKNGKCPNLYGDRQ
ncbi:adenosylcobinamide hydrolase [Methanococcoides vulcani]|uniref:Adenosylcobinamide hydrolase n=1 Tax=Methanococcoides vulcani TaxID=1353158 RepID=A0A1H9YMT1_9EURY|nr:adenosylcobinamide amidohydrolase [Methanococcoides vulcani]SES70381.1 adenosylcobinamide hydrolase [Methanococcoides vulcani]